VDDGRGPARGTDRGGCPRRGRPRRLDGAQAAGAIPLDIDAIGAEFYAVPGQKWLLGPEGTGALAVSDAALAWAEPLAAGYFGAATRTPSAGRTCGPTHAASRSRGSTRRRSWASVDPWLAVDVRGAPLGPRPRGGSRRPDGREARRIPGVTVVTPPDAAGTLLTFRVGGWPAEAVLEELGRRIFLVARPIPGLDAVRLSIGWWNTDDELGRVADAVGELARHTPDTLPDGRRSR